MSQPNFIHLKDSRSKIALHPNPKGIIQFIGSFVLGSFPIWAYKSLNQYLYDQGYSLIIYRFPCNPIQLDHWEVSIKLYEEQINFSRDMLHTSEDKFGEILSIYLDPKNYLWVGHSLGCKFIILLEILSLEPKRRMELLKQCLNPVSLLKYEKLSKKLPSNLINSKFIRDQSSIFLAPEISNTVRLLSGQRMSNTKTSPNQRETECLIRGSKELFNLTGIVSFNWDWIAEDDVAFIQDQLKTKTLQPPLSLEMSGGHFEPLSLHIEELGHNIDKSFEKLKSLNFAVVHEPKV
jgi:Protein of unknown function (DUF1350)